MLMLPFIDKHTDFLGNTAFWLWDKAAAAAVKSLQSCPTLCNPVDGSPPGSWDSPGKNTGVGCHFLKSHWAF